MKILIKGTRPPPPNGAPISGGAISFDVEVTDDMRIEALDNMVLERFFVPLEDRILYNITYRAGLTGSMNVKDVKTVKDLGLSDKSCVHVTFANVKDEVTVESNDLPSIVPLPSLRTSTRGAALAAKGRITEAVEYDRIKKLEEDKKRAADRAKREMARKRRMESAKQQGGAASKASKKRGGNGNVASLFSHDKVINSTTTIDKDNAKRAGFRRNENKEEMAAGLLGMMSGQGLVGKEWRKMLRNARQQTSEYWQAEGAATAAVFGQFEIHHITDRDQIAQNFGYRLGSTEHDEIEDTYLHVFHYKGIAHASYAWENRHNNDWLDAVRLFIPLMKKDEVTKLLARFYSLEKLPIDSTEEKDLIGKINLTLRTGKDMLQPDVLAFIAKTLFWNLVYYTNPDAQMMEYADMLKKLLPDHNFDYLKPRRRERQLSEKAKCNLERQNRK